MSLPAGLMLLWDYTNGSLPPGFEDVSGTYNGYFRGVQVAGYEATGLGNATHKHTVSEQHNLVDDHGDVGHTHTGSLASSTMTECDLGTEGTAGEAHTHTLTTESNSAYDSGMYTATVPVDNGPPGLAFSLIRNVSSPRIPAEALVLATASIGTGFAQKSISDAFLVIDEDAEGGAVGASSHDDVLSVHVHDTEHTHDCSASDYEDPSDYGYMHSGYTSPSTDVSHTHTIYPSSIDAATPGHSTAQQDTPSTTNANMYSKMAYMLWRATVATVAKDKIIAFWDSKVSGPVPSGWNIASFNDGWYVCLSDTGTGLPDAASDSHGSVTIKHTSGVSAHAHTNSASIWDANASVGASNNDHTAKASGSHPSMTINEAAAATPGQVEETAYTTTDGSNTGYPLDPPSFQLLLLIKVGDDAIPQVVVAG